MSIDETTVRKVAKLARIALEEHEVAPLQRELDSILGWVDALQGVDVEGVEPMTSVTAMTLPMREDAVTEGGIRATVMANAPDEREGFYAVPKVVE